MTLPRSALLGLDAVVRADAPISVLEASERDGRPRTRVANHFQCARAFGLIRNVTEQPCKNGRAPMRYVATPHGRRRWAEWQTPDPSTPIPMTHDVLVTDQEGRVLRVLRFARPLSQEENDRLLDYLRDQYDPTQPTSEATNEQR